MKSTKIFFPKQLVMLLSLAVVFTLARVVVFHSNYFTYLLWNIFLALLPFVVSSALLYYFNRNKLPRFIFIIGSLVWILLLPNAPYIVTDLIHIGTGRGAPVLYDAFLLFTSASLGLLLGLYSISHIETIIKAKYGPRIAAIKLPGIMLLTSIGIYIGRYLRFNSWDILTDPSFFGDTFTKLSHPVHFNQAVAFVIPCFVFLYASYFAWKAGIKE